MKIQIRFALKVALALSVLAAIYGQLLIADAAAQTPSLAGSYLLNDTRSDNVAEAIDEGTARMNFIRRPIARGRLRKVNDLYPTVEIEERASEVAIALAGRPPIISPINGDPVRWTREDGEVFQVHTARQDGSLRQTFVSSDGQRENLFTLDRDGRTLRMRVTITSDQLAAPIVYTLVFERADSR